MILACPACATRYVVPDSAIGPEGRTVRCAKCRHSWFQEGPELELPSEPAAAPAPPADSDQPEAVAQAENPPVTEEEPVVPAAAPAPPHWSEPEEAPDATEPPPLSQEAAAYRTYDDTTPAYTDEADDGRSSFDHEPPFRPRRNPARLLTIAAIAFAVFALVAALAVYRFGLPSWLPVVQADFAASQPGLELDFPPNRQDRRTLPNGTEYFGASGTITNTGQTRRSVPTILIVLRDTHDRIVYRAEIAPPKRQLAPGESVSINEAMIDVPKSAKVAEIGWKPG